jgi:hypothetical protein
MCRAGATVEVTYSASARDARELARLGLHDPDPLRRRSELGGGYAAAGLHLEQVELLSSADLRGLGTTWARRLARDAERRAWRLSACVR